MNKKIFALIMMFVLIASFSTTIVSQVAALEEKNNEKFQSFSVTGTYSLIYEAFSMDHQYVPSKDLTNKLVISGEEKFSTMQITVGENTYTMGEDFVYSGNAKITIFDPVFPSTMPGVGDRYPASSRESMFKVDYTYEFLPASGIEGTVDMHAISVNGHSQINSLSGTGDLQNVNIQAEILPGTVTVVIPAPTPVHYDVLINIHHEGLVLGWPE